MSDASWMYCLSVSRLFCPVADHHVPQEAMPGFTHEVSASWLGVARFSTTSLSTSWAGLRAMIKVRHGELCGVLATTSPFCTSPTGAAAVFTAAPSAADGDRAGQGWAGMGGASCACSVFAVPALGT